MRRLNRVRVCERERKRLCSYTSETRAGAQGSQVQSPAVPVPDSNGGLRRNQLVPQLQRKVGTAFQAVRYSAARPACREIVHVHSGAVHVLRARGCE
jgi:hypothetical protein